LGGKVFGHSPSGDIEVVDSPRHPTTYTLTIEELVYVISGHGMGTIGSKKMLLGPGEWPFFHVVFRTRWSRTEKGRFDFSASPIQKKTAT